MTRVLHADLRHLCGSHDEALTLTGRDAEGWRAYPTYHEATQLTGGRGKSARGPLVTSPHRGACPGAAVSSRWGPAQAPRAGPPLHASIVTTALLGLPRCGVVTDGRINVTQMRIRVSIILTNNVNGNSVYSSLDTLPQLFRILSLQGPRQELREKTVESPSVPFL